MAETQQRNVITLVPGRRPILLVGDLLLDTYGDGIVGAVRAFLAVPDAVDLGIGVVLAEANAGQTPTRRQIFALDTMSGGKDVALADEHTAARRRSTVSCNQTDRNRCVKKTVQLVEQT